eukprot:GHVU01200505.1.p3 GENE.GHVU01200505.1~~GHVU01200505.1.p3  ORF type:complete len:191 (-),score=16.43 GHVU01200505.1:1547-2119(-)
MSQFMGQRRDTIRVYSFHLLKGPLLEEGAEEAEVEVAEGMVTARTLRIPVQRRTRLVITPKILRKTGQRHQHRLQILRSLPLKFLQRLLLSKLKGEEDLIEVAGREEGVAAEDVSLMEEIIDCRYNPEERRYEVWVQWLGFEGENTWEPFYKMCKDVKDKMIEFLKARRNRLPNGAWQAAKRLLPRRALE